MNSSNWVRRFFSSLRASILSPARAGRRLRRRPAVGSARSAVATLGSSGLESLEARVVLSANAAHDLIHLDSLRNDPVFAEIDGATGTRQISVAVLDTGLDGSHSMLSGNFRAYVDFVDDEFSGGSRVVHTLPGRSEDPGGHGTHVAGTIGSTNPDLSVAPGVDLIGLRVLGGSNGDLAEGLQWVLDNRSLHNIVAVNMSLGFPSAFLTNPSQGSQNPTFANYTRLIRELEDAGVTVVSAAGNNYAANALPGSGNSALRENVSMPAVSSTIAVGSVWKDGVNRNMAWRGGAIDNTTGADRLVSHSQRLSTLDAMLFAPGAMIDSTVPGNRVQASAGTSMAAPAVTGAVVLLQDVALTFGNRLLNPAEVTEILMTTSETIFDGDDEDDNVINGNRTAYRRLDVYAAAQEVRRRLTGTTPPTPPPSGGDVNDTIGTATPITNSIGSQITTVVTGAVLGSDPARTVELPADVDIYRVVLQSGGILRVNTSGAADGGPDTMLRVFNSDGEQVAADDDGGVGLYSAVEVPVAAGTWYVGVSGYPNTNYNPLVTNSGTPGRTGTYDLQMSFTAGNVASGDQNGTMSSAVLLRLADFLDTEGFDIGVDIGTDPIQGVSERVSVGNADVDMLQLLVPSRMAVVIETSGNDLSNPGAVYSDTVDSMLRLFNATGEQLAIDDDGGEGLFSRLEVTLDPGTYFLGISGFNNSTYNPRTGSGVVGGSTGRATLSVILPSSGGQDPNGTARGAVPLTLNAGGTTVISEFIGSDGQATVTTGDVDLYQFQAQVSGRLLINTNTPFGPGFDSSTQYVDTFVRVFEVSGSNYPQIALSDDNLARDFQGTLVERNRSGTNLHENLSGVAVGHVFDSFVAIDVVAGQTYLIGVSAFGNGSYDVTSLEGRVPPRPDTPALPYNVVFSYGGATAEVDIDGIISERLEPIDLTSATAISGPERAGVVGSDVTEVGNNDVDFRRIRFTGTSNRILTLDVDARSLNPASTLDSYVLLFDSAGTRLAANDDADGLDSRLEFAISPNTDYYVAITGFGNQGFDPRVIGSGGGGSVGNYNLKFFLAQTTGGGGGGGPRERLPVFLSAGAATGVDLDINVRQLDLTQADVFASNGVASFDVGTTPLFLSGTLGTDVDDPASAINSDQTRPVVRNAFGPVFLSAIGGATGRTIETGGLGGDDVDIFPIRIASSGFYDVRAFGGYSEPGSLGANTTLRLFTASGQPVTATARNSDGRTGLDEQLIVNLTAGQYFLVVLAEGSASEQFSFVAQGYSGLTEQQQQELNQNAGNYEISIQPLQISYQVDAVEIARTGRLLLNLSNQANLDALSLYGGVDAGGVTPVVIVRGPGGQRIPGSVHFNPSTQQVSWIPTNANLPNGRYSVEIANGQIQTVAGIASAGVGSTMAEADLAVQGPVISVPGFVRGPSQPVDIGLEGSGLPVRISETAGLTQITLRLHYDPSLLSITGATVAQGMPAGWTITSRRTSGSQYEVRMAGPALGSGARDVLILTAAVPTTAPQNASAIITVDGAGLDSSGASIAFNERTAVQKVRSLADINGDGRLNFTDARLIYEMFTSSDANRGFDSLAMIDPHLFADVTDDGRVNFTDIRNVYDEFTGVGSSFIPAPGGAAGALGPDPTIEISSATATPGSSVTVIVSLTAWEPAAAGQNMADLSFGLNYDTTRLDLVSADVQLGNAVTSRNWFTVGSARVNDGLGLVRYGAGVNRDDASSTPIDFDQTGTLLTLRFTVPANAPAGTATLTLEPREMAAANLAGENLTLTLVNGGITIEGQDTNRAPQAVADPGTGVTTGFFGSEDAPFTTASVLTNDSDPDGDPLSIQSFTQPAKGTVTSNGDGTFVFNPSGQFENLRAGQSETVTFTYVVRDPSGATSSAATVTLTVNGVNDAPVAVNGPNGTTTIGRSVVIPVLQNDSDVDSGLVQATVQIVGAPSSGTATVNADGTVTYQPNAGFVGSDSFTYTVTDAQGLASQPAVVSISVSGNAAPVISSLAPQTLLVGAAQRTLPFTVTDADGDTVQVTVSAADSGLLGTMSVSGSGSNRSLVLAAGTRPGATRVTVTANDGVNAPVSTSFDVTTIVFIDAGSRGVTTETVPHTGFANGVAIPFGTRASIASIPSGVPADLFRTLIFDNPGGEELRVSVPTVAGQGYSVDLYFSEIWSGAFANGRRVFDVALEGSVVIDNLDVFAAVGANTALVRSFEVVGDGTLTIDLLRSIQNPILSGVRVTPLSAPNAAPVISPIAPQSTSEDTPIAAIPFTVTDADNQPLTVTVSSSDTTLLPSAGLLVTGDGSSRQLSVTPAANRFGTANVTVTVSDGRATSSTTFAVTVNSVNDAPVATADPSASTRPGTPVVISVLANDSDVDGTLDPASITIVEQSANGTAVANADGTVTFTPTADFTGSTTFRYSVRDNSGAESNVATVTVSVLSNSAPQVSSFSELELNLGTSSSPIPFEISDADGDTLSVSAAAADASIVSAVTVIGTGNNRQLVVRSGNTVGETTVTVTVSDGVNAPVTRSFAVVVFALIDAGAATPAPGTLSDRTFQNGVGRNFAGGAVRTSPDSVAASVPAQLFRSVLWDDVGGNELGFDVRAKAGERYVVDLFFAELWNGAAAPGRRVFDVVLDGNKVLDDFDIFREAGGSNIGISRRFEIESDGIIDLDLLHGIQNPAIAGLRVRPVRGN